jgi:hypothetical protein
MQVSDTELRELIRAAIASAGGRRAEPDPIAVLHPHPSHMLLPLARGGDGDGACLIEPSVRCNHCGYCLSFGH